MATLSKAKNKAYARRAQARKVIPTSQFADAFSKFVDQMNEQAPVPESVFQKAFEKHFKTKKLDELPVLDESFAPADHPNLHLAIEAYMNTEGRSYTLLGATTPRYTEVSLSSMLSRNAHNEGYRKGPVQYKNIDLQDDTQLACVETGIYLVSDNTNAQRVAVLVFASRERWEPGVRVEVMAQHRDVANAFFKFIRAYMRQHNVYRGKVISLDQGPGDSLDVKFHHLPKIGRDEIILPKGLIERIERQTIGFSRHMETLRAAGRHLKRGMLLFGPPGTGKTLTAMYLASRMPERTVIVITGRGAGLVAQSCKMARLLQPATIVLEDVDLIALERTNENSCTVLLFELLNQMDGLEEDADILFVLTTNRADMLEPALAARPGRIDLALEVPLPDVECRRRLLALYGKGLDLKLANPDLVIRKTKGVSAAFMKELLRKAALYAADNLAVDAKSNETLTVTDHHLEEALHELTFAGGDLTKRLLGYTTQ